MTLNELAVAAHSPLMGLTLTKAEKRRQKRGVGFPCAIAALDASIAWRMVVVLEDGTRWRLYLRGGKTGRRRVRN